MILILFLNHSSPPFIHEFIEDDAEDKNQRIFFIAHANLLKSCSSACFFKNCYCIFLFLFSSVSVLIFQEQIGRKVFEGNDSKNDLLLVRQETTIYKIIYFVC